MTKTHDLHRKGNVVAAGLLLIIGVLVFTQTTALGESGASSDPGAAGYPRLIAGVLIVLAVLLTLQRGTGDALPSRADGLRVVSVVVLLVTYALALEAIGYIAATAVFLAAALLLMGIRSWLPLILLPVGFSVALFLFFYNVFGVSLPREFLERLIS
ncbi:putative tricarboxylic transport membrane protein [Arthrobacter pigmenti]|uniref:Putative tricarboxylic transport membrane protein n=1 Tax=Arthrobacter pigmenti TaxID=271432 RepID=A0A846RK08_9MICC|nr:tripartite tricarboxylate transporter TctB family protein [Arthrobacter pigmenti]NJC21479.1 putative tricarboxylic transport membrane protein [Arthrobacter pigmenti]